MTQPTELTTAEFRRFQEFIYRMSGIRIPESKRTLLSNRVRRRLRAGDFADFRSYFRHLSSTPGEGELVEFLDAITTNETYFFRTEPHFDWFRGPFVSEVTMAARRGERDKRLRIWSAACSTGEEPYSLAIGLAENRLRLRDWQIDIVGTDLSGQALAQADEGIYAERALQKVDETRRRRHFTRLDSPPRWQVRPSLREHVRFRRHNLLEPFEQEKFDCIWIRNVLIYFDQASKQRVVDHLIESLREGGYLVVGPSEGIYDMLGSLRKHETYLYQK